MTWSTCQDQHVSSPTQCTACPLATPPEATNQKLVWPATRAQAPSFKSDWLRYNAPRCLSPTLHAPVEPGNRGAAGSDAHNWRLEVNTFNFHRQPHPRFTSLREQRFSYNHRPHPIFRLPRTIQESTPKLVDPRHRSSNQIPSPLDYYYAIVAKSHKLNDQVATSINPSLSTLGLCNLTTPPAHRLAIFEPYRSNTYDSALLALGIAPLNKP